MPLEGSLTSKASEYPQQFCDELADNIVDGRRLAGEFPSGDDTGGPRPGALESLFFNEVLESAPWATIMQAACGGDGKPNVRTNVIEIRAKMRAARKRAHTSYNQRPLYGMYSQVGLGVCSMGRSPSFVFTRDIEKGRRIS